MEGEVGGFESALIDQKMRADRHKSNFEALKIKHVSLQETCQRMRLDYETLSESYDNLRHKSQEIIEKLQIERDDKIIECENLKNKVMTAVKLEKLRLQLVEEIEEPYKKHIDDTENELEALRSEHNKLKYDYAFLKSEYESAQRLSQSLIEEISLKSEAEILALKEENKELLARQERDVPTDIQRIRQLEREANKMQEKMKGLITENEELRTANELAEEHKTQNKQLQSRQITELQAFNKTLEMERSSLAIQTKSLQKELSQSYHQHHSLSEQLTMAQRELTNGIRKLEQTEHNHAMETNELKMHHLEHCRELEIARDKCVSDNLTLRTQLETLSQTLEKQDALLAEKEQQIEQRAQQVRGKEWEKQMLLEKQKVELEEKIAVLQRLQSDSLEEHKVQLHKLETVISEVKSGKSELESKLEITNSQLEEKSRQLHSLIEEVQQLSKVSRKYQALYTEHKNLQLLENDLRKSERKLEEMVHHLEEDLTRAQQNLLLAQEDHRKVLEDEKKSWLEEREVLNRRIEECQTNNQLVSQKLAGNKTEMKKLQKHYKKEVHTLQQNIDLGNAKMEEMKTKKEAEVTALKLENQRLKNQFSELQRRQKEYLFFLHHDPHFLARGKLDTCQSQGDKIKHDLQMMSDRVGELETSQNIQLSQQEAFFLAFVNQQNSNVPTSPLTPPSIES